MVLLYNMGDAPSPSALKPPSTAFKYSTVTGYFLQDAQDTDPASFDYSKQNLGLIDQPYDTDTDLGSETRYSQWQKFEHKVERLNDESPANVHYKLLFLGRHAQGYHNVAEDFYGTHDWDAYWSKLDGNGTITWADARLTDEGIAQARIAHDFWRAALKEGIPPPARYYTSPLDRCCATANVTFSGLDLPAHLPFVPTVKELLRETIGMHTCDRRSPRTVIQSCYPAYIFPSDFTEADKLFSPTVRETDEETQGRVSRLLDDVFESDAEITWISLTSHSGAIRAILKALGHRDFDLLTGAVIPVLVKAMNVR